MAAHHTNDEHQQRKSVDIQAAWRQGAASRRLISLNLCTREISAHQLQGACASAVLGPKAIWSVRAGSWHRAPVLTPEALRVARGGQRAPDGRAAGAEAIESTAEACYSNVPQRCKSRGAHIEPEAIDGAPLLGVGVDVAHNRRI